MTSNVSLALARTMISAGRQMDEFDPWTPPDSFTVYNFAPDYVRPFLHDHWKTQKAVHPIWAYFLGFYYLTLGIAAVGGNVMVLKMFGNYPSLRSPGNTLVVNLAFSDLCLMIALIPEAVINFFSGGPWQFGEIGCQIHAFCGAFFGYSQIFTLTIISWDRYNVIVNGFNGSPLTYVKVVWLLLFNWLFSLFWAVTPLVGWGRYALDGMLGTCSFDTYSTDMNHKSYIMASCWFTYFLPVIIIMGCYAAIVSAVYKHEDELRQQAKKMNVTSLRSNEDQEAVSAEIKAAKVAIMNVTLWIFAWGPFTIVSMLGTWWNPSIITPLLSEVPIMCAKSSAVYNPIIYALSHPKYRECLKDLFPWLCIVVKKKDQRGPGDNISEKSIVTTIPSTTLP